MYNSATSVKLMHTIGYYILIVLTAINYNIISNTIWIKTRIIHMYDKVLRNENIYAFY